MAAVVVIRYLRSDLHKVITDMIHDIPGNFFGSYVNREIRS